MPAPDAAGDGRTHDACNKAKESVGNDVSPKTALAQE